MRTALLLTVGWVLVLGCSKNDKNATAAPQEAATTDEGTVALAEKGTEPKRAPEEYTVELDTTKGPILIDVYRAWSPNGADRFYELVETGYYTDVAFFRVIDGFMAQAGIHGEPAMNAEWRQKNIPDDPVKGSNTRGTITFAMAGPDTRTTQFFINFVDNTNLDTMGFSPFGKVRDMNAVDALHSGYGEGAPRGRGPSQGKIQSEGNAYLKKSFPKLDYIKSAKVVETNTD